MRKLKIDDMTRFLLREAFKQDADYELNPQLYYLDLSTGDVTWVYERDEDAVHVTGYSLEKNREERLFLQSQPDRFVLSGDDYACGTSCWLESDEFPTNLGFDGLLIEFNHYNPPRPP